MTDISIRESTRVLLLDYLLKPTNAKREELLILYGILWQHYYRKQEQYKNLRKEIAHTLRIDPKHRLYKRMEPDEKYERRCAAARKAAQTRIRRHGDNFAPSVRSFAGHVSGHLRWHVARHIVNPKCDLCLNEELNSDERS
jgi:hypothetical protein